MKAFTSRIKTTIYHITQGNAMTMVSGGVKYQNKNIWTKQELPARMILKVMVWARGVCLPKGYA